MSKFNERFRYIKSKSGISAKEMSKMLGVSPSTIGYYLNNRDPNTDVLLKIAKEFNVSVNWLVGYEADDLEKENTMLRGKLAAVKELLKNIV